MDLRCTRVEPKSILSYLAGRWQGQTAAEAIPVAGSLVEPFAKPRVGREADTLLLQPLVEGPNLQCGLRLVFDETPIWRTSVNIGLDGVATGDVVRSSPDPYSLCPVIHAALHIHPNFLFAVTPVCGIHDSIDRFDLVQRQP